MDEMVETTRKEKQSAWLKRHSRAMGIGALVAACLLGTLIWYVLIYRESPEFAVHEMEVAMRDHDPAALRHAINFDTLLASAYDDLTVDLFAYDATLTDETKVLFERFYVLVRPQIIEGTRDMMIRYIETGEWTLPAGTDILKGRSLGIDYERFIERSLLRHTTIEHIGEVHRSGDIVSLEVDVREDYTGIPFTLELSIEKNEHGRYQIARIRNYRDYLDAVAPTTNQDIARYIEDTKAIVARYNKTLEKDRERFVAGTKTQTGEMTDAQRAAIAKMLENEVIPALKKRQRELDQVPVPKGATYLAAQRVASTEATVAMWQQYIRAMREKDPAAYARAEALHKDVLDIELRIEEIIRHTAVSKNISNK